jgi:hypothetical protein
VSESFEKARDLDRNGPRFRFLGLCRSFLRSFIFFRKKTSSICLVFCVRPAADMHLIFPTAQTPDG